MLLGFFDRISVINLPERTDRRREIESALRSIHIDPRDPRVEFFAARKPARKDDWPSLGARGCFLSHSAILRDARDRRLANILIAEDDCEFAPALADSQGRIVQALAGQHWDIVYLGHVEPVAPNGAFSLIRWTEPLMTAHLYAVNRSILDRLVAFLELVERRPEGHLLGGPQHYDGALSMFRAQNPDVVTLIAAPNMAFQRSSSSDVSARWFDKMPGLNHLTNRMRRVIRRRR
ncbi:MAG TPA: glycosyltransferase family 25 protein [Candidatus Binataceae bacterium]|nr:glycosyltransferase family 25 protein [Candidatus Binataceae bacterium]